MHKERQIGCMSIIPIPGGSKIILGTNGSLIFQVTVMFIYNDLLEIPRVGGGGNFKAQCEKGEGSSCTESHRFPYNNLGLALYDYVDHCVKFPY